jgi:hypothetical protein
MQHFFLPEDGDRASLRKSCTDLLCGLVVRVPSYRSIGLGFDSHHYQIFWEVGGLERGSLSLVSITEELLGRNSSGFSLENREYGRGNPLNWPRNTLYQQKSALTSPTCCGRSVGILRLRAKTTECFFFHLVTILDCWYFFKAALFDGTVKAYVGVTPWSSGNFSDMEAWHETWSQGCSVHAANFYFSMR